MSLKRTAVLTFAWIMFGLAPPTALADWTGPRTGVDWWNYECKQDWAKSPASSACSTTSDGEPKHVAVVNQYNTCSLKAECPRLRQTRVSYITSTYQGRNVDVRALRNCDGHLKVSC